MSLNPFLASFYGLLGYIAIDWSTRTSSFKSKTKIKLLNIQSITNSNNNSIQDIRGNLEALKGHRRPYNNEFKKEVEDEITEIQNNLYDANLMSEQMNRDVVEITSDIKELKKIFKEHLTNPSKYY